MTTRIRIDLNARSGRGLTYAGFEDVFDGPIPREDQLVEVFEEESGLAGPGRVTRVDYDHGIVHLAVVFHELAPPMPWAKVYTFPTEHAAEASITARPHDLMAL